MSTIKNYYKNKGILITGSTGFMGKVLVSKILRSVGRNVGSVYLLIRPKKGKSPDERLQALFEARVFEDIPKELINQKVHIIAGDITEPGLGISESDINKLIENVNIIFHSAATVKFDDLLTLSVAMNIGGTLAMIELARKIKKLESFVHVSTAYCNPQVENLQEQTYHQDMKYTPESMVELVKSKGEILNEPEETKNILGNWPNTYTFTKAIAEKAVFETTRSEHPLPISIMRPSVVVASYSDPFPGWVDNLNGPTGIIAGAGSGVLRTMLVKGDMVADLIPVDLCINLMIVMAHVTSLRSDNSSVQVFNCVSGDSNPIYWNQVEKYSLKWIKEYPFERMFWYPNGSFKESIVYDRICQILFQKLPSYIGDFGLIVTGQKPFFCKLNKRMTGAFKTLEYFAGHTWNFKNPLTRKLYSGLSPEDKNEFHFDVEAIDWNSYLKSYTLGVRHFILKGTPQTLPQCRRKLNYFYALHLITQVGFLLLLLKLFSMFYSCLI